MAGFASSALYTEVGAESFLPKGRLIPVDSASRQPGLCAEPSPQRLCECGQECGTSGCDVTLDTSLSPERKEKVKLKDMWPLSLPTFRAPQNPHPSLCGEESGRIGPPLALLCGFRPGETISVYMVV